MKKTRYINSGSFAGEITPAKASFLQILKSKEGTPTRAKKVGERVEMSRMRVEKLRMRVEKSRMRVEKSRMGVERSGWMSRCFG